VVGLRNKDQEVARWLETRFASTYRRHRARVDTYPARLASYNASNIPSPKAEGELRVLHPLVKNHVRQHMALLAAKPPVMTIPIPENVDPGQIARIEDYLWACYDALHINELIFDAIFCALVYGEGYIWGPLVLERNDAFPLTLFVESPEFVFAELDERRLGIRFVFRRKKRLLDEVQEEIEALQALHGDLLFDIAPLTKIAKTSDGNEEWVWYNEYFGPDRRGQVIHCIGVESTSAPFGPENYQYSDRSDGISFGDFVKRPTPWPDDIPVIPVILSPTPQEDPAYRADSLAADLDTYQKTLVLLESVMATSVFVHPNAPLVGYGLLNPNTPPDLRPGAYNALNDPNGFIRPIGDMATNPQEIMALLDAVRTAVTETSLPPSMFGQYMANMTGIALSLLNQPSFFRTARGQRALERVYERLNASLLQKLEVVRANVQSLISPNPRYSDPRIVNLEGIVVPPGLKTIVKLSTATNQDVGMLTQAVSLLVDKGIMSRREGIEIIQNAMDTPTKNVEIIENEIIREQVKRIVLSDPNFIQALIRRELSAIGISPPQPQEPAAPNPAQQAAIGAMTPQPTASIPGMPPGILPPQMQVVANRMDVPRFPYQPGSEKNEELPG